jgi:beta-glucosidase
MKKSIIESKIILLGLRISRLIIFIPLFSCSTGHSPDSGDTQSSGFDPKYEAAIDSILRQMTLEEKVHMVYGNGMFVSGGAERFGIPELHYTDGPTGIREEMERNSWKSLELTTDSVTFFPTGTALAATWNEELAFRYGKAIGSEANARGKDILLGPGVNIIRSPLCGRNFEYFSEDPLLNTRMAVDYVRGVQTMDVAACAKHFALNNQEQDRGSVSVETDERSLREIYLPVYQAVVQEAQVYTLMAAYNKFRGHWMGENDYLLNKVLKEEWGFKGFVISDWGGTHSTIQAARSGLDVEMGGQLDSMHFSYLKDSVLAGLVPESILDDKVKRILRVALNCGTNTTNRIKGKVNSSENIQVAYDVACESIVLLKNDENLLPLETENIKSIGVIGLNAVRSQASGGHTAGVKARYEISPLQGLKNRIGKDVDIHFAHGYKEEFLVEDSEGRRPRRYPVSEPDPGLIAEAVKLASSVDVAIIFAGNTRNVETEGRDRETLSLPFGQDHLIKAVSDANPNTIVVVVAGAACDLNATNKHVSAILYSWFNGSEAGNAIADVLTGVINPSGKLPFTIPRKISDIGAHALNAYPGEDLRVEYSEGILVGYRWFDTRNIRPRYCFGHGLSYTAFDYSNLDIKNSVISTREQIEVSFVLENVGDFDGKETVQLYIQALESSVPRAAKELKAFKKIDLSVGEASEVEFSIDPARLAWYNTSSSAWIVEPGRYKLLLGSSSRDIREELEFVIE